MDMSEQKSNNEFALKDRLGFFTETHPFRLYIVSILVGLISAFAAVGFIRFYLFLRKLIYLTKTSNFLTISQDTSMWYFFLIFIVGGALIGLFVYYALPYHGRGHGMPHLLYVFRKQEHIPVSEGIGSSIASSASIAMGASVGREAPLMFLAGSITSWACKIFKFDGHYYRILFCAAVATAFATSIHSTFVAIFFVLEVLAFSLTAVDLIPIALALFSGTIVREFSPNILPPVFLKYLVAGNVDHILYYVVLGILCGFLALIFVQSLKFTVAAHLNSKLPKWLWPAIGGLALSFLAIYAPTTMGLSFEILHDPSSLLSPSLKVIVLFIILKFLATYLSVGFGFSGGIITPVFIIGLFFGILYAITLSALFPGASFTYSAYAVAATAALTGATIGAPLALTMATFELTRNMPLTVNVFAGVVVAQLIMKFFKVGSFYQTQYTVVYQD